MFSGLIEQCSEYENKLYDEFVSSDPCCPLTPHLFLGPTLPFQIQIISLHVQSIRIANMLQANDLALYSQFSFTLKPNCSVYDVNNYNHLDLVEL